VKALKTALFIAFVFVAGALLVCTIKNDNGSLAVTGPGTTTPVIKPASPPVLIVTLDSSYIGIGDTLTIAIKVMTDSSLTKALSDAPIACVVSSGWLSKDSLRSDTNGRAVVRFSSGLKSSVTMLVSCYGTIQTVHFDVTNAPDKIQKSMSIIPVSAILKADGKDNTIIKVVIRNANNNPVVGECIQFITTAGTIAGAGKGCADAGQSGTDSGGVAQALLTSENQNDTAYVTALLASDRTKNVETKVVFKGVTVKLAVDSTNLKVGGQALISATVLNASNEPVPYASIFFSRGKDTLSNLSFISRDTVTGSDGMALAVVQGNRTGSDSIRVAAAGALSSTRITVTDLILQLTLSDRVLQARATDSTSLHVLLLDKNNNGIAKDIKLREYFKKRDGTDTSAVLLAKTSAQGKCDIALYALPYEGDMRIEAVAFDNTGDLASAVTTLSFITTRTMTVYATPTVIQADGTSKSAITVQIKNKDNNPIVGDVITFVSDAGWINDSDTTDASGKAIASLTSDRRNTIATVTATLAKDPTKSVTVTVEFSGVNLSAAASPPTINSSGKDTAVINVSLLDAAKNPIVGEKLNFHPLRPDVTHLANTDSVTNNRGEARCEVYGTGVGSDTISIKAAGAVTSAIISYSSNYLAIDTPSWQPCYANGKDSTRIRVIYREGDRVTPITNATIDVSVTIGSLTSAPVFTREFTMTAADNGVLYFYMKNPNFANTATITASATTDEEKTSAAFQLYFRASKIKRIELSGTPEVIAVNNGTNANKAKITGVAYDSMDNRVQGEFVAFNLIHGPGGGEYLDPPTAMTGIDGSVTTNLVSGTTPSMFRDVLVAAGDLSAIKSDTIKFTFAGSPYDITIRTNILTGIDYKDGTFGLPCAAIVTDVNGNPVADGTEVTFSCKISGWVFSRPYANFIPVASTNSYTVEIDSAWEILPFEDFNNNFKFDPDEDRNGDGVASRGEDLDGDGLFITGPTFADINHNGKRDYLPGDVVEPYVIARIWSDSLGSYRPDTVFADFNRNGKLDTYEPLTGQYATMSDPEYTALLNSYMAQHHGKGYDFDTYPYNGIADPSTAVSITRTVQTVGGKAVNTILYGQSDALRVEIMAWAESQGIKTISPAQLVLPIIAASKNH
jgi:hypothetical protein